MKDILLSTMGTSPQVLTETLYAIHMQGKPFPDEVYLITSENAREKVVKWLFENNQIENLKKHYDLPDFKFDLDHILLMHDSNGAVVVNGRGEEDQQSIADSIMDIVANFTSDNNCRIHASIAGGRKTMAFYMGYAMSIFGREQDILSHVFVSQEFEFSDQFFFPTLTDNYITHHGKVLNTKDAKVILTEIPFVRMKNIVDQSFLNRIESNSFSKTVEIINTYKKERVNIFVSTNKKAIIVDEIEIGLPPKELAFYLWLSQWPERKINVDRQFCDDPMYSASYLKLYSMFASDNRVFSSFGIDREIVQENTVQSIANQQNIKPFERNWIQQARSKINAQFRKWLEPVFVDGIEINSFEYNTQLHEVCYFINKKLIVTHDLSSV